LVALAGAQGRQLDADARSVVDDARADLDQTLADVANSAFASGSVVRNGGARTACISQNAAVWKASRT